MIVRDAKPEDTPAIERMLAAEGLPLAGLEDTHFVVADRDGTLCGAAGLEVHEPLGLLRSVVVAPSAKGTGVGRALTEAQLDAARARGLSAIYLLTTTAEGYFPRFGFERVTRDEVPAALLRSRELQDACPASAVILRRAL